MARGGDSPSVLVYSERNVISRKWHALQYEFEDVGTQMGIADVLAPAARTRGRTQRLLYRVQRDGVRVGTREIDVESVPVTERYDLFYAFFAFPSDIPHMQRLQGWRERCDRAICFIGEHYTQRTFERPYFELLRRMGFDHVFVLNMAAAPWIESVVGCPVTHLGHGVDSFRFNPYPDPPPRVVDLYQYGRRSRVTHEAALRLAREDGRLYLYDTVFDVPLEDWRAHRTLVAETLRRTQFFFAYALREDRERAVADDPMSSRYWEAIAAGAVLLGSAPNAPEFARHFPWPDAVIDIPYEAADLRELLAALDADPARLALARRNNVVGALRGFDWAHVWATVLDTAGLERPDGLRKRLAAVAELADVAEAAEDEAIAALS